jgi:hypothetical protein
LLWYPLEKPLEAIVDRKQLEECAWKKTPKDERRSEVERYDWKTKKSVTKRLRGNEREVLVFDPSGSTPGSMSPWVPLWSLYSDELEQRCREEQQPKLRSPYNRMRSDYTGDVESSPGTQATREGARRHHATKKSAAQLDREIAEALGRLPYDDPELQAKWRVEPSDLRVGQRFDYFGKPYEITKIGHDKARTIQIAHRFRDRFGKEDLIDHRSFPMRAFYQQHLRPLR